MPQTYNLVQESSGTIHALEADAATTLCTKMFCRDTYPLGPLTTALQAGRLKWGAADMTWCARCTKAVEKLSRPPKHADCIED